MFVTSVVCDCSAVVTSGCVDGGGKFALLVENKVVVVCAESEEVSGT